MLLPRIIPCLLLQDGGLVKTEKFADPKYVGDPINAVRIFNEKLADELMLIDIDCTVQGREPRFELIQNIAAECRMPLAYGGGVKTLAQVERIIGMGVEKVALSSAAISDPGVISRMASAVGSQSIVAVLDIKKAGMLKRGYRAFTHNGKMAVKTEIPDLIRQLIDSGIGELVVNFIDLDGTAEGYDIAFAKTLIEQTSVPLTILGGARDYDDLRDLVAACGLVGAAAGRLFVFKGRYKAVLISYPDWAKKEQIFAAMSEAPGGPAAP